MEVTVPVERTLTQVDYVRLTRLLQQVPPDTGAAMQDLLENSEVVASPKVPPTVVTMYTQLLLHGADGAPTRLTVCYPEDAEPALGFISVLSPVGTGLLGRRAGETVQWPRPGGGEASARILAILFQPEACGDYET
jgi:regulator of nucleoside diphosphate kinase